jgi:hypothetical protein
LKEEFSDYLLIANYNFLQRRNSRRLVVLAIHRKGFILELKGIDVNIYNGDLQQLVYYSGVDLVLSAQYSVDNPKLGY